MTTRTEFNIRQLTQGFPRAADEQHEFLFQPFHVRIVEMEDLHFHFDSAVLMPDYDADTLTPDADVEARITSLAILSECLREAERNPNEQILIAGHTDTAGSPSYNVQLSQMRGDNALAALTGDREGWVQIALEKHKVEDYQLILKWADRDLGFNCDPGEITNQQNAQTTAATRAFQERYNQEQQAIADARAASGEPAATQEFSSQIGVDGVVGRETWRAFFDIYMRELRELLDVDDAGMAALRNNLHFVDDNKKAVGCGENFPIEGRGIDGLRSRVNRRVEIMFFTPPELPTLDCHPAHAQCVPGRCEINRGRIFRPTVIPVPPVLPRRVRLHVHLQLAYVDPQAAEHAIPQNFPVAAVFGDGSSEPHPTAADGHVTFFMDRRKQSLSLRFDFSTNGVHYLANATAGTTGPGPERLLPESELDSVLRDKYRLFELPLDFSTRNSDWKVNGTTTPEFTGLDQPTATLGTRAAPVRMNLDPHWQHYKFLYFDRKLKQKLSIPPIVVEAFFKPAAPPAQATDADRRIRSNWTTSPEACQCIPWILRKRADGTDLGTPDGNALLKFRTKPRTFIDSSGADANARRLITITTGGASLADPAVNEGVAPAGAIDMGQPNAARLSFYDLPEVWKSRTWFVRLSGGSGAVEDVFETLGGRATTDTAPLLFQLDDIVLADASLNPLAWNPSANPLTDRVAVFVNHFSNAATGGGIDPNLSTIGLFKPDATNNQSFFSQKVKLTETRNYIGDYPDWTRVVVAQGNVFDVFDKRIADGANRAVGARAGVRWTDSASLQAPGANPARPNPVRTSEFCIVQAFYEQRHNRVNTTQGNGIGRFDLALLRCCDLKSDNTTELAQCLNYFRFAFNFNPAPNPTQNPAIGPDNPPAFNTNPPAQPVNFTGVQRAQWVDLALRNIPTRWTGPDGPGGSFNPGPAVVAPVDRSALALEVKNIWFAQDLPRAIAHFELGIFRPGGTFPPPAPPAAQPPEVRAYMASNRGYGTLGQSFNSAGAPTTGDNQPATGFGIVGVGGAFIASPGWFTAAHETGHGGSLGDEYLEPTSPAGVRGYRPIGFDSNMPGGPYQPDDLSMMVANSVVRPRYFWHVAQWLRFHYNADFQVEHGGRQFRIPRLTSPGDPARPFKFTHVNWPMASRRNANNGTRGNCDVFFYPLGAEDYSVTVLPGKAFPRLPAALPAGAAVAAFDGIIVITVKMRFNFHVNNTQRIHGWLQQIEQHLDVSYNYKFTAGGTLAGQTFNRALLHFSPRYFVPNNYSPSAPGESEHFRVNTQASGSSSWTGTHQLRFTVGTNAAGNLMTPVSRNIFRDFFGEMVGLPFAGFSTAANYNPVVQDVIPGATTSRITA